MPVTLKLATSLDGRIATGGGESRWITGEAAREAVHRLRATHDAVVVGAETALADDPDLTVRLANWSGVQPARVVLDSRQRTYPGLRLVKTAGLVATYVVTSEPPREELIAAGVRVLVVPAADGGRPDLRAVVEALSAEGLHTLFVEGGGQVAASFLRADLVDRLEWFRAPIIIGSEGRSGIGEMDLSVLAAAVRFRRLEVGDIGPDLWETYERA